MTRLFSWAREKYDNANGSGRFYGASMIVAVSGMLLSNVCGPWVFQLALSVASFGIIGGFVAGCIPVFRWLNGIWQKPFGKTPIVILHLLVLLVSTVLARWAVTEALGLPPQSFDVTVGFAALFFYIPAWMFITALLLSLLGLLLLVVGGVASILMIPLAYIAAILNGVGLGAILRRCWDKLAPPQLSLSNTLGHAGGAILSGSILMACYGFLTSNYQPWIYSSIRLVAVLSDFQPAIKYPGVKPGEMIHPLDNGFVAVARQQPDKSIAIWVKKQTEDLADGADELPVAEPIPSMKQLMDPLLKRVDDFFAHQARDLLAAPATARQ